MAWPWHRTLIAAPATREGILRVLPDYEAMLLTILDAVLARFERDPSYRFVDTKLSVLTGRDYPELPDQALDFKGRSAIYPWIQGRGLEALAGHAAWIAEGSFLPPEKKAEYRVRIAAMASAVMDQMEELRQGRPHWPFVMTPQGQAFDLGPDGRRRPYRPDPDTATTADLFYGKGLFGAARLLRRPDQMREGCELFRALVRNIESGRCRPDQIAFGSRPPSRPEPEPGRREHAWRMIAILGFATFAEALADEEWLAGGERFIRDILEWHVNRGQWPELQPYDFAEAVDGRGRPGRSNGAVLCDPGHVLEFVGVAAKFLLVLRGRPGRTPSQARLLEECRELLPRVALQAFRLGYNRTGGGIYKQVDLLTRVSPDGEMPWWNLPETLRAAAGLLLLFPDDPDRAAFAQMIADCSNGFVTHFVNPHCHLMAYQTLDARGRPVDAIPATPDADPGYHTGLSVIDFMAYLRRPPPGPARTEAAPRSGT